MEHELFIKEVRSGIYLLDEGHEATGYLVVGEEKACVIDTMNGWNDLCAAVRRLTDKPLVLVNTHGHPDHILGNIYFDKEIDHALISPRDRTLAESFFVFVDFTDKKNIFSFVTVDSFSDCGDFLQIFLNISVYVSFFGDDTFWR